MFTNEISTAIKIEGTPEEVWAVLADLPRWPEWNPGVESMEGELVVGSRLRFSTSLASGRKLKFRPRVLVVAPGRELRWLGRVVLPGLFDGSHRHERPHHRARSAAASRRAVSGPAPAGTPGVVRQSAVADCLPATDAHDRR